MPYRPIHSLPVATPGLQPAQHSSSQQNNTLSEWTTPLTKSKFLWQVEHRSMAGTPRISSSVP